MFLVTKTHLRIFADLPNLITCHHNLLKNNSGKLDSIDLGDLRSNMMSCVDLEIGLHFVHYLLTPLSM